MSKWEENSILIERYLDGDLKNDEKNHFEKLVAEDSKLFKELEFHKQLRRDIKLAEDRKEFKNKLNNLHHIYFSHSGYTKTKNKDKNDTKQKNLTRLLDRARSISLKGGEL